MAHFHPPLRWRGGVLWWLVAGLSLLAAALFATLDWYLAEPPEALAQATYVGRASCIDCHQTEHELFTGSHHDRAMEIATDESVLGDFNDTTFERLGVATRFFRQGEKFFVNTEGPDGEYHDYEVKYTFGVDPLQQYMVEFPDGRVQVLRVSWDTHRQEWFYVSPPDAPDERLAPDDPTHWTGIAQNWNTTCAECHSTNLQKNYDLATDTYATTWSEIDVSCEACHGPGSLHVKLAESPSLFWDRRHGFGLRRLKGFDSTAQIETCTQCHSRREAVHPEFRPGLPFDDHYRPSLLSPGLYHADGQILDEVYVYGSFLQSRMHREGVRCSDCHDPHSLELKFEGNALCAQCHVPARYDTPAHHHHEAGTPGASCIECHMPATTYMVVDPRRDHSIRVPRPDLTVSLGTPNACNGCHTKPEESAAWAAAKVVEWYGPQRHDDPHWAPAIAAGRAGEPEAESLLLQVVRRQHTPAIVRATAYELLGQFSSQEVVRALVAATDAPEPLVRQAAVRGLMLASPVDAVEPVARLLTDPIRTVRIEAARQLLPLDVRMLDQEQRLALAGAVEEYRQELNLSAERGGAHVQLARLALRENDRERAEHALRTAMRLEPYLTGPRSELAQLLSETGGAKEEIEQLRREEIERLERDIGLLPAAADFRYQLGLLHYQVDQLEQAENRLAEAHELAPQVQIFLLALARLQQARYERGDEEAFERAVETLKKLNALDPQSPDAGNILRDLLEVKRRKAKGDDEPL